MIAADQNPVLGYLKTVAVPALLAVITAYFMHRLGGFPVLGIGTLVLGGLALRAAQRAESGPNLASSAGVWLALWPLSGGLWRAGVSGHIFPYQGWSTALIAFLLLSPATPKITQSWAPPGTPVARLAPHVLAGFGAAIIVQIAAIIAHVLPW